jgi:hypothetical protein
MPLTLRAASAGRLSGELPAFSPVPATGAAVVGGTPGELPSRSGTQPIDEEEEEEEGGALGIELHDGNRPDLKQEPGHTAMRSAWAVRVCGGKFRRDKMTCYRDWSLARSKATAAAARAPA